ncbi:ABC transporter ATP-binding protein [Sanguibacter sp. A247]|uniref:ABC transporter ATP-binding protein n=1 Tax=unclassified Sanguibacter TaxID=2645534 RepID=UPI003FD78E7A
MLSCHELTKTYRGRRVLDAASLEARPGAVTGLLGPNGAGKTTLLKIVLGLTTPDSGQVRRPVEPAAVGSALEVAGFRRESRLGAVLAAAATRRGLTVDVTGLLERVGLPDPRQRVSTLSLGMTQRLRVAMALLGQPELLVLDEPLNGLDPQGIRWLRGVMRAEADRGTAVLVSSHLLNEAEHIVDDIVVLDRGRVAAQGPRNHLLPDGQRLEDFFFRLTDPLEVRP